MGKFWQYSQKELPEVDATPIKSETKQIDATPIKSETRQKDPITVEAIPVPSGWYPELFIEGAKVTPIESYNGLLLSHDMKWDSPEELVATKFDFLPLQMPSGDELTPSGIENLMNGVNTKISTTESETEYEVTEKIKERLTTLKKIVDLYTSLENIATYNPNNPDQIEYYTSCTLKCK